MCRSNMSFTVLISRRGISCRRSSPTVYAKLCTWLGVGKHDLEVIGAGAEKDIILKEVNCYILLYLITVEEQDKIDDIRMI